MSSLLPVTSVSAARWFFLQWEDEKEAPVIISSEENGVIAGAGSWVSVKRLTEEYGVTTTTILPYYFSKIRKILSSETHLASRVSDKGLWTSNTLRPLPCRSAFTDPVTRQWIAWCTNQRHSIKAYIKQCLWSGLLFRFWLQWKLLAGHRCNYSSTLQTSDKRVLSRVIYRVYRRMSVRLVKWGFSQWGQTVASITCLLRHLSVWATELQCTGLFPAYQTDKIAISCTVVYRVFQLTVCVISPYRSDKTTVSQFSLHSQSEIQRYLLPKTWEKHKVKRVLKQRSQGKTRTGQTIRLQCIHVLCWFFFLISTVTGTCQI